MEIRRLNTLRGLAAIIVAISHFSNESNLLNRLFGEGAGQLGVMLFFILSGFLMGYLYFHKPPTQSAIIHYITSRVARIFPLFFIVVIASFLTPYFYDVNTVSALLSHLFFLHGEGILWTIPAEVHFYGLFLLAWIICWKLPRAKIILPSAVFLIAFLLHNQTYDFNIGSIRVTISALKTLPFFTLGCLFGILYLARLKFTHHQRHYYLLAILFIPLLYPQIFFSAFGLHFALWGNTSLLIAMGTIFFFVVFLVPDGNRLIENKLGDFYGKISYSLYLLHMPAMFLLKHLNLINNNFLSLILFLALSTFLAFISYTLIEKLLGHFMKSKIKMADRV